MSPESGFCLVSIDMPQDLTPTKESYLYMCRPAIWVYTMCLQNGMTGKALNLGKDVSTRLMLDDAPWEESQDV